MLDSFHFLRPEYLLLVILLPLVFIYIKRNSNIHKLQQFIDRALLKYLQYGSAVKKTNALLFIALLSFLFLIIAAAGPSWKKIKAPSYSDSSQNIIILDLSLSMYAKDGELTRLQKAKYKIEDLLKKQATGLHALIVYSDDAYTVAPLTDDSQIIIDLLYGLEPGMMPGYGSNIVSAFNQAYEMIEDTKQASTEITIISDDIQAEEVDIIEKNNHLNIDINVIAIGKDESTAIQLPDNGYLKDRNGQTALTKTNIKGLQQLAKDNGGIFTKISNTNSDIDKIVQENKQQSHHLQERQFDLWEDQAYWFLLLPLLFCLSFFRKNFIFFVAFICLFPISALYAPTSSAIEIPEFLLNTEQRAHEYFKNKQYAQAIENYSQLTQDKEDNAIDYYNLGNALTMDQQYTKALEAFSKSLSIDSDFKKAKHNKEIVEKLIEKEKEKNKKKNQNGENKQDDKKNDGSQQESSSADSNKGSKDSSQQSSSQDKANSNEKNSDSNTKPHQEQKNGEDSAENKNNSEPNKNYSKTNTASQASNKDRTDNSVDNKNEIKKDTTKNAQSSHLGSNTVGDTQRQSETVANTSSLQNTRKQEAQREQEQWLNKLSDQPADFLRNKFRYQQYQRQRQRGNQNQRGDFW